jgi:NAD(P)H dehydrogenase (quinone)
MMLPLIHHGMLIAGVPYSEAALSETRSGGTPYGATHVESESLTSEEIKIARSQGSQIADLAQRLLP